MTARLDLHEIGQALIGVERAWPRIDGQLQQLKLGRKAPFTPTVRCNMLSAYAYLDQLLEQHIEPFSDLGMEHMLALNRRIHYGDDDVLVAQFASAIDANIDRFNANVEVMANWYWKHLARGDHPYVLAAQMFICVLGRPQLFDEGNHRTGSLIASWVNLRADYPPFVLSVDNAIAYFAPSEEIKQFADRSTWRGRRRLPKYRKSFGTFWANHVESKYVLKLTQ